MSLIKTLLRDTFKKKELLILALPGLLLLLAFNYLPMFGLFIAFKDINYAKGLLGSDWVGFKNFEIFFALGNVYRLMRNTVGLNFMFIVVGNAVAVVFALLLYELKRRSVKVFQTILFIPFLLSWVVASYVTDIFLNHSKGIINIALLDMGLEKVMWYFEPSYWPIILLIVNIWKGVGYGAVIYYAALMSIDSTYYEAAALDGANRLQQVVRISLPMISPLIILLFILSLGKIFTADFGLFYFVTRNNPMLYEVIDVIDTFVFRMLRVRGDIGISSAMALIQSIVGCVFLVTANFIVRRVSPEKALF